MVSKYFVYVINLIELIILFTSTQHIYVSLTFQVAYYLVNIVCKYILILDCFKKA